MSTNTSAAKNTPWTPRDLRVGRLARLGREAMQTSQSKPRGLEGLESGHFNCIPWLHRNGRNARCTPPDLLRCFEKEVFAESGDFGAMSLNRSVRSDLGVFRWDS